MKTGNMVKKKEL